MSKKDIFGDDIDSGKSFEDFEALFAASEQGLKTRVSVGDQIRGEILSIGKEESFVSTGTPVDGLIFTKDLLDENKEVKYHVGDMIDVVVISAKGGEIRLAKKGSKNASTDSLEDAFDMELPVTGTVTEAVNGGLRVNIQGKTAFCPVSQIDSKFVQDTSEYVGRKFDFLITQMDKRNMVVSRRKLLDLQKAEHEGVFMEKHKAGDILEGRITRLEKFGAFVELEAGVEGLVHLSELTWSRVHSPQEVVSAG
ncbi:MAG: S1 RNA-binding domain-containing protein, partial [Bacillota bacterium]